jgi:hypothetical protein
MFAHRYQVWSWGTRRSPSTSTTEQLLAGITTLAKRDTATDFEVFNELVSTQLALAMGLNVPVGVLLPRGDALYFASLKIGIAGEELPGCNPDELIADLPGEACGIVVFDAWLANVDRHERNLWYDDEDQVAYAFDHGCAVLNRLGIGHLRNCKHHLAIDGSNHCLVDGLKSLQCFRDWHTRICNISEHWITHIIQQAEHAVLGTTSIYRECAELLIDRRDRLPDLFRHSLEMFRSRENTLFDPLGYTDDYPAEYCI